MPPVTTDSPLTTREQEDTTAVGRRLGGALRRLLQHLPPGERRANVLSRRLGIDRNLCQRAVAASRADLEPLLVPTRAPGHEGLRAFIDAARRDGADADAVNECVSALEDYARLIGALGGSQAKVSRRIEASAGGRSVGEGGMRCERTRKRAFEANSDLLQQSADASVQVVVFQGGSSHHLARVNGLLGLVSTGGRRPVVYRAGHYENDGRAVDDTIVDLSGNPIAGRSTDGVLEAFSSSPVPIATTRSPRGRSLQVLDRPSDASDEPADVFIGHQWKGDYPHPSEQDPPLDEAWALTHVPCRGLVFDTFLCRELVRECIPSLGVFMLNLDMPSHTGDRWTEQMSCAPPLRVLPTDLEACDTPLFARHTALLRHVFEALGENPSRYSGYRCELRYPVWGAGYCLTMDYARPDEDD